MYTNIDALPNGNLLQPSYGKRKRVRKLRMPKKPKKEK